MSQPNSLNLNCLGDDARLRHVGIAVRSIDAAAPGAKKYFDPLQNVRVAFVDLNGAPCELVEPVDDQSPVNGYLRRDRVSMYHFCFEVSDLAGAIKQAREHGFRALGKPKPAVAFGGRRIAWVYSPVLGLIELLEDGGIPQTGLTSEPGRVV